MFIRAVKLLFLWICAASFMSCGAPRTVSLQSQEVGSQISLVSLETLESPGTTLSNPASLERSTLVGKAVRFSAPGKSPQYWLLLDDADRFEVRVKQLFACEAATVEGNRNRPIRLLMKAYQALSSGDFRTAKELASKASEMNAALAAPYIVKGLAHFRLGEKDAARAAFTQAKGLDPEDGEIEQLIRMVE